MRVDLAYSNTQDRIMDVQKTVAKFSLLVTGMMVLSNATTLTESQIQKAVTAPWTKTILQVFGASLIGLGVLLPSNSK
jgi:hypothetical protein